jgi:hypothetical protein
MSIYVELHKKGGKLCEKAKSGEFHCPLIVRPTSEDVIVGNVFGALKHIPPHLWLNPLLNKAIDGDFNSKRFRQVWFKDFSLRFWERQAAIPYEILGFKEGRTEPDVIIEWENPATTIWIEAKWNSPMAKGTSNNPENDQITRGLRTLAHAANGNSTVQLFKLPERAMIWIALTREELSTISPMPEFEIVTPHFGKIRWEDIRLCLLDAANDGEYHIRDLHDYLVRKIAERQ